MKVILTGALIPVLLFVAYLIYRFLLGYKISKCMKVFHDTYDYDISNGKSKREAFIRAVEIFKKCHPFDKLSETDWENICCAFPKLGNPKDRFLRVVLYPSGKVISCFKNPDFFRDLLELER